MYIYVFSSHKRRTNVHFPCVSNVFWDCTKLLLCASVRSAHIIQNAYCCVVQEAVVSRERESTGILYEKKK